MQETPSVATPAPAGRRSLVKRPWFWASTGLVALIVIFTVMFFAAVPLSSDTLRHRIVKTLSEKLDSDVELGDLHLRVFPGLRAEGADLRIRRRGMGDYPPLIAIKSFHVDASLVGLWRKHVDHVRLDGLDIRIPPSQARDRQKAVEQAQAGGAKTDDTPAAPSPRETPVVLGIDRPGQPGRHLHGDVLRCRTSVVGYPAASHRPVAVGTAR